MITAEGIRAWKIRRFEGTYSSGVLVLNSGPEVKILVRGTISSICLLCDFKQSI